MSNKTENQKPDETRFEKFVSGRKVVIANTTLLEKEQPDDHELCFVKMFNNGIGIREYLKTWDGVLGGWADPNDPNAFPMEAVAADEWCAVSAIFPKLKCRMPELNPNKPTEVVDVIDHNRFWELLQKENPRKDDILEILHVLDEYFETEVFNRLDRLKERLDSINEPALASNWEILKNSVNKCLDDIDERRKNVSTWKAGIESMMEEFRKSVFRWSDDVTKMIENYTKRYDHEDKVNKDKYLELQGKYNELEKKVEILEKYFTPVQPQIVPNTPQPISPGYPQPYPYPVVPNNPFQPPFVPSDVPQTWPYPIIYYGFNTMPEVQTKSTTGNQPEPKTKIINE